jgi:hypothetical protein
MMHIDWFLVLLAVIAIPPFVWAAWLVGRDAEEKRKRAAHDAE